MQVLLLPSNSLGLHLLPCLYVFIAKPRDIGKVLFLPFSTDHSVFLFRLFREILFLNVTVSIKRDWFAL